MFMGKWSRVSSSGCSSSNTSNYIQLNLERPTGIDSQNNAVKFHKICMGEYSALSVPEKKQITFSADIYIIHCFGMQQMPY